MAEEEYLTLLQVARITQISHTALKGAIRSGKLKATKPMRRILVHRRDLDAFMEGARILPKSG